MWRSSVIGRLEPVVSAPAANAYSRPVADSRECQLPVASSLNPPCLVEAAATLRFALLRPAHAVCGDCASVPIWSPAG
jgi:hypothetical protein